MLNASYFRNNLPGDVAALGGTPIVELMLLNGLRHRIRAVLAIDDGFVTLETYQPRPAEPMTKTRSDDELFGSTEPAETERVAIAYDSIVEVMINPARKKDGAKIGFHQA